MIKKLIFIFTGLMFLLSLQIVSASSNNPDSQPNIKPNSKPNIKPDSQPVIKAGKKQKVYVIPVSGMVEPGMTAYIKIALEDIKDDKDAVFVFKMDTFGGRVDAALDIVDIISNVPKGKTIAYVEKRAISAGALIALSSNLLFMKNNTIIGDCAPIINTKEGQQMAGEKVQTVLRAKFRALAKKNNYPVKLAESMVTIDMEIYQITMNNKTLLMDKKEYDDFTEEEKKQIKSKKQSFPRVNF